MSRRWRKRKYIKIKEVVLPPKEVERRKAHALQANAKIAEIQIPHLQADLLRHQAIVENYASSHGIPIAEISAMREKLGAKQRAIRKAEEEIQLAHQRAQQLAREQITAAKSVIERITESDKRLQGTLSCLFFGYKPSPEAINQIAQQNKIIDEAESVLREPAGTVEGLSAEEQTFITAFDMTVAIKKSIRHYEAIKNTFLGINEAEQKRKQKQGLQEATGQTHQILPQLLRRG